MILKIKPEPLFINKIFESIFKLKMDINNFKFIRNKFNQQMVINNFNDSIDNIKIYYPKYYINNITNISFNNIITILNHFLKIIGLKIIKHESTFNNKKIYTYFIGCIDKIDNTKKLIEYKQTTISFN